MMHQPWDCAQPDEWLPQSLRLCWGSDGGDGGGGGFSGDSGGWGSDSGGANTGGGDWGSSGSYDASGFNAGGDLSAWAGSAYDASTAGTGMGGGGDWGSFGDTSYGSFNAPNPIFTDVAGPNPGVFTGGGDWGSAGMFSAEGTGGGPNGAMVGATQGAGSGFWGGDTGGGGLFGDYGGGGGGGATYGGGGQQGGNQSAFGGFTTPSNTTSTVGSASFGQVGSVSARSDAPTRSEAEVASVAAPTRSEAEISSVSPEAQAAPDADPDAQSDFGKPAEPDAAPEAAPVAAPEVSSTIAASRETNFDYGPSAAPEAAPAAPSHFGPQSINADYEGSPYASNYDQGAPSQSYQQASQYLSDLTQSALAPVDTPTGMDLAGDFATNPSADLNWGSVFEGAAPPGETGKWSDLSDIYSTGISNMLANHFDWGDGKSIADINNWLSSKNQETFNELGNLPGQIANIPSQLNTWVNQQSWGPAAYALDQAALGEQGKGQTDLASQLGIESISAPTTETDTTPWGSVFEGAAPVAQDLASQLGIESLDTTPWGSVFEGAPSNQNVDWDSVFEGAAPEQGVDPGAEQYGIEGRTPAIEAFIPGGQVTNFEYGPQSAGAPTTPDDASTPGGDPALSGLSADAAAAAAAAAAAGAPGQPGQPGQPGTQGQPATAPAQGGPTFVSEAAVSNVTNAVSNTALNIDAPMAAVDAVSQAAHNAMLNLNSPAEVAAAVSEAALANGATQAQADALAAAALNAANSQSAFTPGQPGQQQQAPSGQQQPGAPEGEQTTSTTSAFIPGQLQTNFDYAPSQPAPQSLIDMAPAQPGTPMPQARPADAPQQQPPPQPGQPQEHDDAPEPQDTSQPPQDPNAPRPPANVPGQVIGARGTYTNDRADNPRTNSNYRNSGRTDYPQGRPGIDFRTARQAGIEPLFRIGDINVHDLDARLVERINRAMQDMPANLRDDLEATSGWRPAHRGEAHEHGMDPRTSQESVYSRYNPNGRNIGPAAQPGRSNHAPGRAIDFRPGPALSWLRAHAREYGLETLGIGRNGRPYDVPHIQLRGDAGGARPSAQEQQAQRATDAQNRQVAIDRGLIAPGRGQAPTQVVQPTPPPGGWRGIGGDIGREARLPQQPEVTQPAALPPVALPDPVAPRPPADIPPPAPVTPAPFLTPPVRGRVDPVLQTRFANDLLKDATKNLNKDSGQDAFQAASVVAAKALAAAGIPLALARDLMTKGALDGAIKNGYGPGGPNSTVMGFSIWGKVQSAIADGVNAALQGYKPAAPGPVQGPYGFQPDAPAVPGKQGALPSGQQYAGLSQSTGPAPENYGRGTPALQHLSPIINPQPPTIQNDWGKPPAIEPPPPPLYKPGDPGMFNPFRGNEAELQPEAPSSLLSFLQNFNPISTAEARSTGRSQASQLQAPRADSGTIQSRLAEARSNIINELQTNQGLRNTLDLIATGEVGSQGKAAVLGWLETAMNKAAAEASQQGRAPTGRDLLNYLNNRSYFPDTWGKIESGKIKGGALTDDLLSEVGAGSNTTKGSTGNSSSKSEGSRFGGNPTNVTIGREHYGVENYAHHAAWYNALGAPEAGRGIGSDFAAQPDMSAVVAVPPVSAPDMSLRGLAKGGHVKKDEPVVVGEEGPEYFVPDQSGTVVPHMPQKGGGDDFGRWPKLPTPDYPGRYAGVGREMKRQMREAQNPIPTLIDLIDSGQLRLTPNWHRMLNDPSLIALGQSRMGTVDAPAPEPAAEPPDPTSSMAQALGYGSIRRPMRIGRQSY